MYAYMYRKVALSVHGLNINKYMDSFRNYLEACNHKIYHQNMGYVRTLGPNWVLSAPGGLHVGPMNFGISNGLQPLQYTMKYFSRNFRIFVVV